MTVTMLRPRSAGPKTAFVLGGGGNLGAIQVGMLRALVTRGIKPDVIYGCSVGALNAAAFACDPTINGVERMQRTWLDPVTWQVFSSSRLTAPLLLLRKGRSMVGNQRLRQLIESTIDALTFETLRLPLRVVATSLASGNARWFTRGPIIEPILASAALPAVLPPVVIDGAVVDNVPISQAVREGAERIVVLHVGNFDRPRPTPQRPLDVLLQAFSIARNHRFATEVAEDHGVELLVLPGVDPGPLKRNDFSKTEQLIDRADAAAAAYLDSHGAAAGM
jgi:NTE family protein